MTFIEQNSARRNLLTKSFLFSKLFPTSNLLLDPKSLEKSTKKGTSESYAICFPNCHSSSGKKRKYKTLFKI